MSLANSRGRLSVEASLGRVLLLLAAAGPLSGLPLGVPTVARLTAQEPATASQPAGLALLVGCTRYDNLAASYALQGPGNDVLLMRELLVTRFGFAAPHITILSESEGAADPTRRPTRTNIEREFGRLRDQAQAGTRVVVFLAGHGSQQPDQDPPDPADPEPDGLDEIFLPADAGAWDGGRGTVVNSIRDDEIRRWLAAIQERGATVWAIFDACHSGTLCRGVGEKRREVPVSALVPASTVTRAVERVRPGNARPGLLDADEGDPRIAPDRSRLVAIYAAQSTEPTVEQLLPPQAKDARPYGLLTYALSEVLTRAAGPLTYNDLIERVHAQYEQWGRTFPTPLVEGPDRDHEVLGAKSWAPRARMTLRQTGASWTVSAGAFHGLTLDTILAVQPPPGEPRGTRPLGYVRIVECDMATSVVEACDHGGIRAADARLTAGASCEVAVLDIGDLRLTVAIDEADHLGRPVAAAERAELADALGRACAEPNSLLQLATNGTRPDWLVRKHGAGVFLVPASGVPSTGEGVELPPLYGPAPQDDTRIAWIVERLTRVARARNLIRLSGWYAADSAAPGDLPRVELEPRLLRNRNDRQGTPLIQEGTRTKVHDGDRLGLRITNPQAYAVDVTLLYIDASFGIAPLFPQSNEINRLGPQESIGPLKVRVAAPAAGLESLLAIAVRAGQGRPVDFVSLAQPSLELAEGVERTRSVSPPSRGLGALLRSAAFGQGRLRAVAREEEAASSVQVLSWQLVPRPRPVAGGGG
ncbi:MAG: caspase family protein [Pirellulales bacterium]